MPASGGSANSEIWEIGPGIGSLTDLLRETGRPLRLFEIDRGLIAILRERYGEPLRIETGDALQTLPEAAARCGSPAMIVGNLPYASASAIVARIIETPIPVGTMLFLVQKELAERFTASVGSKEYSALSVLVQNHYTTTTLFHVGGNAFYPRPEVGSTVIAMRERPGRLAPELSATTSHLARTAFSQRRKAIRNSLKDYRDGMKRCGIDEGLRPERLSPEEFVVLAREITRDRTPS
jgi:16S rRNA (adenine1518-N6/adenine1519-N6)-dimethyltransferase